MDEQAPSRTQLLFLAVAFEGGMGVLACLLGWLLDFPPWRYVHWRPVDLAWAGAATLPMIVVFVVLYHRPVGPMRGIKTLSDEVIAPLFRSCSVLELAFISLLAGFGEEGLFRGFLQPLASHWLGDWAGLVISSILFGLVHPFGITYIVLAALAGMYFGLWMWFTDNLLVAILAHAGYDFVALLILVRGRGVSNQHSVVTQTMEI